MTREKRPTYVDDLTIRTVAEYAAEWTGYQPDSVSETAVRRALRAERKRGASLDTLRQRAADSDPELVRVVSDALAVGETYFFRNPDQFESIAEHSAMLVARGQSTLRAWSAGCATGEEAYSLAATLLAVVGPGDDAPRIEVIGTDSRELAIDAARRGGYRASSIRASGPLLHPVLSGPNCNGELQVLDRVRDRVTFAVHDLREPPIGTFDIIVCRNVLLYFSRPVVRTICQRLASALAPNGLLVFGTMDVDADDAPTLRRISAAELQLFVPLPVAESVPPRQPPAAVPARIAVDSIGESVVAHRAALVLIESGRTKDAARALRELNRCFPSYLPGLLERALHEARHGDRVAALERMYAILDRVRELPSDHIIEGIDALPASFYATSAREFLSRHAQPTPGPNKGAR